MKKLILSTLLLALVGCNSNSTTADSSENETLRATENKADVIKVASWNIAWLGSHEKFDAVIIGFQADIYHQGVLQTLPCTDSSSDACDAFVIYRQAFQYLAKRINKPVLISHGDTGEFCFEKLDKNLWHLNAAGDFRHLDATKVTFNKDSTEQPFTISGLINPELPTLGCKN